MTTINPIGFPELYDTLTLNETFVTPLMRLSGLSRDEVWDVKDGNGQGGASITRKGEKLAKFTTTFALFEQQDHDEWQDCEAILRSCTAGKDPVAITIWHPEIARLGVDRAVVESSGQMEFDDTGGATIAVKWIEYRPPKPKGGAPKAKKASDPNADVNAKLDGLVAEAGKP